MKLDEETLSLLGWGERPTYEMRPKEAGALVSDNTLPLSIRRDRVNALTPRPPCVGPKWRVEVERIKAAMRAHVVKSNEPSMRGSR